MGRRKANSARARNRAKSAATGRTKTPQLRSTWVIAIGVSLLALGGVIAAPRLMRYLSTSPGAPPHQADEVGATAGRDGRQPAAAEQRATQAQAGDLSDGAAIVPVALSPAWEELDDPSKDGWETEAFNELANRQLKSLGKLLTHPEQLAAADLTKLVTSQFSCQALRPQSVEQVFQDHLFSVERAHLDLESVERQSTGTYQGTEGLADALRELTAPYRNADQLRAKFKLTKINQQQDSLSTTLFLELSGQTSQGAIEQHAVWSARWSRTANEELPTIEWIGVADFEEVIVRAPRGRLFEDCTASVLRGNSSFQQQIMRGVNHWLQQSQDLRPSVYLGTPGIAVGDVNGDGLDDLFLCQGWGLPNRLFKQQPDGSAVDVSQQANVDWLESAASALFLDLDNDSDQDLIVAIVGHLVLASNNGEGVFQIREVVDTSDDTMTLAAADYDSDGDVDLYVCAYTADDILGEARDQNVSVPSANFVYHDSNRGGANSMFRNDIRGDQWEFVDVTRETGLDVDNRRNSLAAAWEDFDNDGDQDLYVANDFGRNCLYRNDGGTFTNIAPAAQAEDSASGMSVIWSDLDRDGYSDLYVGNMFSSAGNRITYQSAFKPEASPLVRSRLQRFARGNTLLRNLGNQTFDDVSVSAAVTMGRWAWGCNAIDINNDGWEDLIVSNGYITTDDTGDM